MSQSLVVFVNGISSVFLGMAVLYGTIRFTAFAVRRWAPPGDKT